MMDTSSRKGGCLLVPRYGGAQAPGGMSWQMGRIMLKFRPIAPKPAAMAPAPPQVGPAAGTGRGTKRKATAGRRGRRPKKALDPVAAATQTAPAEKESDKPDKSVSPSSSATTSVEDSAPAEPHQNKAEEPAAPVASCWVAVEDVTSTWRDGDAPPAASACGAAPAFVSDQWGRVTWSNAAFARAVDGDVALAGALPAWGTCAGFTCRVRVRHAGPARRGGSSVVAPCDVWRLDAAGCYLWRLDLQAALTLGGGGILP